MERLLALPYRRELIPYEDGTWFAKVAEMPGCMTEGDSREHALEMLDDAMRLWLTDALENGDPIPPPAEALKYSGKFQVRIPPSLHRQLAERAEREGVSLNQLVTVTLAGAGGPGALRGRA
ncbi:MAG: type II toxin-antitoxin system HicB family antitoxin [Vulcanimicrobiaceae bacterium]